MWKKFKDRIIRKLGGYRTVYAEKTVVRNFSGERVHATIDVPNEYSINRELTEEKVRRELADRLAKYIFENMPIENISKERVYASDSVLYSADIWIDYDCNLQRRSG